MAQTRALYRLQQIDSEIKDKKGRLLEVLNLQKESAALLAARERVKTAVSELEKYQAQHQKYSTELEDLNAKTKRSEQRLYSGNVKNPKELSDLESEIKSLSRRRSALEDDILETMVFIEDAEGEKDAAEMVLTKMEAEREASKDGLAKEQNELALSLHHLTQDRKKQADGIDARSLGDYENLRKRKNGVAVARLKINQCQACFTTVSASKVTKADRGELVYCGGCGRILVN
jgi:predicted  nucleic acid-binding Zn-ribbon protein